MSSKQSRPIKRDPAEEQSLRESSQARRVAFAQSATRRREAVVREANRHDIQASIDAAFLGLDQLERAAPPIAQQPAAEPARKPSPPVAPPPIASAAPRPRPVPPPLPQAPPPEPARAAQPVTAPQARTKRRRPRFVVAASIVVLLAAGTVSLRVVAPHHPVWTQLERAAALFRH